MAGTTVAAIVDRIIPVLLKPASTTPLVSYKFVEVLEEAGLPAGVVNFVPGSGAEVRGLFSRSPENTLHNHLLVLVMLVYELIERASKLSEGQIWIKACYR